MKFTVAIAILGSLVLLSGCANNPTDIPEKIGYQGFINLGWEKYHNNDFQLSLDYFLNAIDIDPSKPEAYLGAGWASLYLPDVWRIADNYFYMAIQQRAGYYPINAYKESQVQDTMWTKFECLHPDLSSAVLNPILALTADSGLVYVADSIHAIVGDVSMPYRFKPLNNGVMAILEAVNGYTTVSSEVDSIAGGWVYITVPLAVMSVGGHNYYTWINVDNQVSYDYRILDTSGSPGGQILYDALAGSCILQDIRGENGDPLLGCVEAWAIDFLKSDYSFGHGLQYEGYESLNNMKLKGTAAALAFYRQHFRFAWFTCTSEGQGTGLNVNDPTFVTSLMTVIQNMLIGS